MTGDDDLAGVAGYILTSFGRTTTCHDLTYKNILSTMTNTAYTSNISK